ncbi:phosphomethylpyrimidine kinase [Sulfolobus sp. S-194]|uniref:thiamine-phosphate synthase family protein n=1 Tax=Sulfolobus sp. S-194 TaxID=2512240 RepID=UPI0014372C5C|nr:thiamine-phosphate synthase family protein [Sulfolobus sp. S-194]QIW24996.1 phosphomethylpyrimidine kinase [Sulfolobus sp. S-194]
MNEREEVLIKLKQAVDNFVSEDRAYLLIPEIRTNIGYAISDAKSVNDVAAIPGRLTVAFNRVIYCLPPAFGASDHVARVILTAMTFDKKKRSSINLKYYKEIVDNLPNEDTFIFNREEEPEESRKAEGHTMNFMMKRVYEKLNKIPTYVIDLGGYGKEPTIFILDEDPLIVVKKALNLLRFLE